MRTLILECSHGLRPNCPAGTRGPEFECQTPVVSYDYVTTKGHPLMARCEDYPCCGHTDGLGCNYVPDMDYYYARAARMDYDDYYYDEP